ncbi:MAG TPA: gliding motility-associated C-terminal domain-containing protein, partial [Chryseosolibacter sp.]
DASIILTISPAATVSAGSDQTVCIGTILTLDATIGGSATFKNWVTSGDGTFDDDTDPQPAYTPGANDLANGNVTLTAATNNPPGVCAAASDDVIITFMTIPGDQITAGTDTWIGYVYDDTGDLAAIPARIDFSNSKYRGFIEAPDIDNMSAVSTYDAATDVFDLNLDIPEPIHGPNVCGNLLNAFSIRYKMTKTLPAGIYRFTVGADDGIRLLIDGVNRIPETAFALQSYTTYTTAPICLSGAHEFEIHYFDNDAFSRLTFDYEEVPALTATSPVEVCINSTAPVLTASSTDPGVVGFNWYKNGALIFTGPNYTPAAAELDMTTAGTNSFQVAADYGCGEAETVDVIVEVTNSASLVISPQTICESGGIVDLSTLVSASPAGGTFTFAGHPNISGGTDFNPSGLSGTVSILVDYSTASCTAPQGTLELTITNSAATTVPSTAVAVCESAGAIDLTTLVSASPSGGTFAFSGPQGNSNIFDPSGFSGLNSITVEYSVGGCVSPPATFEIDVTTTASITTTNATACPNGSSVNLLSLVSPTPPGGTFSFAGNDVVGNIFTPGSSPGTIYINVDYDINGCTDNGTIQITVLAPTDPLCTGGNCASVVIVPKTEPATCTNSDGRMVMSLVPFTPAVNDTGVKITIDGVSSTNLPITRTIFNDSVFNQLPVGSYTYSIEYGDPSCIKTGIFSIDQSGTVGTPQAFDVSGPICAGSATGSVTIDVPGETGNVLEWSLDGGLTDPFKPFTAGSRITGIPAGPAPSFQQVISVRRNISDVCYSSVTIPMYETVTEISATYDITSATCNGNDGAITGIVPAGGHGAPYTFSLDGGVSYQSTSDLKGLAGGMYTLRVKDVSGCEQDFSANITFPGFINFNFVKENADCAGNKGSILVGVPGSGPFKVALGTDPAIEPSEDQFRSLDLNAQFRFPDLQGGQYFVFVKSNASSCSTHSGPIDILDFKKIGFDLLPDCNSNELSLALLNITGDSQGPQLQIKVSKKMSSQAQIIINEQFPGNREIYLDYDQHAFLQTPGVYQINIVQVQQLGGLEFCDLSSDIVDFIVPEPVSAQPLVLKREDAASYPDIPTGKLMIGVFKGGLAPYDVRIELDSASSFSLAAFDTEFEKVGLNSSHKLEMFYQNVPPGRYTIEVTDSLGCSIQFTGRVPLDESLFIPNVFTPNGDDLNDVFFIRNLPQENPVNQLIISNRWGKQVFTSDNYQNNWDGTGATDGIYFYRLQLSDGDTRTGWVEIMRGPKP